MRLGRDARHSPRRRCAAARDLRWTGAHPAASASAGGRARAPRHVLSGGPGAAQFLLLLVAGAGAGLIGSVAGLASLISYPALLATGLSPVAANVTNTVALVFSGVGSALGSQRELTGQSLRLRRLGVAAAAGGAVGGGLLLLTPEGAFEAVVPVFIAVASLLVLVAPSPDEMADAAPGVTGRLLTAGIFGVGIYGGYFGAAAGVMMMAMLLLSTRESTVRALAAKNALLGIANGVAALGFVLLGPVRWSAVVPLALGFLAGGRLGPAVARRLPGRLLKLGIAVAGLTLAVALGWDTWA